MAEETAAAIAEAKLEEQKPAEQQFNINIKLPEPIKMVHWHCYSAAANKYRIGERKADRIPDEVTARFHGAVALIKQGYVTIEGIAELAKDTIAISEDIDLLLVGILDDFVALPIEAEMNNPLLKYFVRRSDSKGTQTDTSAPPPLTPTS